MTGKKLNAPSHEIDAPNRYIVFGGAGFVGRHIVDDLLERKKPVAIFDIIKPDVFNEEQYKDVVYFKGDVCNKEDVLNALQTFKPDTIIYPATPNPLSKDTSLFYKVNVEGTRNVIELSKQYGVKRFVLTSSASVVNHGGVIINGDENMPYVKGLQPYSESKIQQEKEVLAANSENFRTIALRPNRIWGPRDATMCLKLFETAKAGRTKFYLGNGKNLASYAYVKNVSHAHILAAEKLHQKPEIGGKAYFITDDNNIPFWTFVGDFWEELGYSRPYIPIPVFILYFISYFLLFISFLLRLVSINWNPPPEFDLNNLTYIVNDQYFSCEKAKKELDYKPIISYKEGMKRTAEYFSAFKKEGTKKTN